MKIAITADLHLTTRKKHPERYHALENILQQCVDEGIQYLIVAGDLFDAESRNYSEFEALIKKQAFQNILCTIIPGNHDARLGNTHFTAKNIIVFSEPIVHKFDLMSLPLFFVPYKKDQTMGETIASFHSQLPSGEWILIGHGDWVEGMHEPNPLEPGVYMPLTRVDLESYQPLCVVLGHIHKPTDREVISYPGSPCPLDINETGKRRYFILETENGSVQSRYVDTDMIYFNESIVVLPVSDEAGYLLNQIHNKISAWHLSDYEKSKTKVRIKVQGYTKDKRGLLETITKGFTDFTFYDTEPNMDDVGLSEDLERAEIAQRAAKWIQDLHQPSKDQEPDDDQILLEALKTIYEV